MMRLTDHARERICMRLGDYITPDDVEARVNQFALPAKKTYVEVKKVVYCEIHDPEVKPDGIAKGNQFIAVCENGAISTVLLRKSWENSREYRCVLRKPNKEKK